MRALTALLSARRWKGPLAEAQRLLAPGRPAAEGIGAKLDAWLASPAWELRNAAVKLIAKLNDDARYPRLLEKLCDRCEAGIVRRNAADAIGRLGLNTPEARTALARALSDRYWEVRSEAAMALAGLFPPAEDLERAVLDLLYGPRRGRRRRIREHNFEVRMACALALGCLGIGREAFDALTVLAGDDSWLVRGQAVVALAHFAARHPDHFAEARGQIEAADRLSEGAVSYFVLRDTLSQLLCALGEGPQGLAGDKLRTLYLDPKAGWNHVRR